MQWSIFALIILGVAQTVWCKPKSCGSDKGSHIVQFNGEKQDLFFPCKYMALKEQRCGRWRVTIVPGNRWIVPDYQLHTLWLHIKNTRTGEDWSGRTSNKLASKYINQGGAPDLFNMKGGSNETHDLVHFGHDDEEVSHVWIKDKFNSFKIIFSPWDPFHKKNFPYSNWQFTCTEDDHGLTEYPEQFCGGEATHAVRDRAKAMFDLEPHHRINSIYFDAFTDNDITQTSTKCANATKILTLHCADDARRIETINNCAPILHANTRCITRYGTNPMDVFNACLMWGCTGTGFDPNNKDICAEVAEGVDFCPHITFTGNLSARVTESHCLQDFLPIQIENIIEK